MCRRPRLQSIVLLRIEHSPAGVYERYLPLQAVVQEALERMMHSQQRTVLVIAHRLSTVQVTEKNGWIRVADCLPRYGGQELGAW